MINGDINDKFNVILLGIIFDPAQRKILIGRQEGDPKLGKKFTWGFPGAYLEYGDDIDKALKEDVKKKTGYDVKNLGTIFSKIYPENNKFLAVYFLCEVFKGQMKPGGFFKELKWVKPDELEDLFTTSFHPRLREYIMNLK
jgi:ADP-ribose pyrophosphatase YjhB (NUDIX family)